VTLLTAANITAAHTHAHEATAVPLPATGDTTMTNLQTSQIQTLADAELDGVAGGFRLDLFKTQASFLFAKAHHPIDNASSIIGVGKAMVNNFLGGLDNFGH
jgi:hypothetical protein